MFGFLLLIYLSHVLYSRAKNHLQAKTNIICHHQTINNCIQSSVSFQMDFKRATSFSLSQYTTLCTEMQAFFSTNSQRFLIIWVNFADKPTKMQGRTCII